MPFTGTKNVADFVAYIINSQGWDDSKKSTVERALYITLNSIINRRRWSFRQKEDNFTLTKDIATYDLSTTITDYKANPIIQVKINDNPPLTHLSPENLDNKKHYKQAGETEQSGVILYWTVRERGAKQVAKLELLWAPDNSSDKAYVLWLKGLTKANGTINSDMVDYLLEHWSDLCIAGVVGSLQAGRKIITAVGVIEEGVRGVPTGYPPFEAEIELMIQSEPIIETLDPTPQDSNWTDLYEEIYNIN